MLSSSRCVRWSFHLFVGLTVISQTQTLLSDARSQKLFDLLRTERDMGSLTTQDLINFRKNTERIVGTDENLFRMVWVSNLLRICSTPIECSSCQLPESKIVTIQLLGKDDSSLDDSEALTSRWQAYVDSYVSVCWFCVHLYCCKHSPDR